ncbi:MAG: CHAD domain-containing protein [Rhodomicrobium sp.]
MDYRLSMVKPLNEVVPAIAASQLDAAIERLRSWDHDHSAIHEARKHFKRTRALLGLVSPISAGKNAKTGGKLIASAAKMLSASRDAQVVSAAAESLLEDIINRGGAKAYADLISLLRARRDRVVEKFNESDVQRVIEEVERAKASVAGLDLRRASMGFIIESAAKTYRQGRRAMKAALKAQDEEPFHEWRKLAQRHWRQMMLLYETDPKEAKKRIKLARFVSDHLGLHHDLSLLRETILLNRVAFSHPNDVKMLCRSIDRKQAALLKHAAQRGRRLYEMKPKAFAQRLLVHWQGRKGDSGSPTQVLQP